jgi:NYN domain-containing protein/OST-HTH/LOTUS domain-containing protein
MDQPSLRLAVLIDADNASVNVIGAILDEVSSLGTATVKRIYGNFTSTELQSWGKILAEHAIQPIQQYRNTIGKNASDSALIIDAMDLLHTRHLDGFCLVSSDSDFTRLATRIKEDGLPVYGFGEKKTPNSFVKACNRFFYTEILRPALAPATVEKPVAKDETIKADEAKPKAPKKAAAPEVKPLLDLATDEGFQAALDKAIDAATPTEATRAHLATVGLHLQKLLPEFDARNYGFKKLSDLLEKIASLKLSREGDGGSQTVYVERL